MHPVAQPLLLRRSASVLQSCSCTTSQCRPGSACLVHHFTRPPGCSHAAHQGSSQAEHQATASSALLRPPAQAPRHRKPRCRLQGSVASSAAKAPGLDASPSQYRGAHPSDTSPAQGHTAALNPGPQTLQAHSSQRASGCLHLRWPRPRMVPGEGAKAPENGSPSNTRCCAGADPERNAAPGAGRLHCCGSEEPFQGLGHALPKLQPGRTALPARLVPAKFAGMAIHTALCSPYTNVHADHRGSGVLGHELRACTRAICLQLSGCVPSGPEQSCSMGSVLTAHAWLGCSHDGCPLSHSCCYLVLSCIISFVLWPAFAQLCLHGHRAWR